MKPAIQKCLHHQVLRLDDERKSKLIQLVDTMKLKQGAGTLKPWIRIQNDLDKLEKWSGINEDAIQ